jgi:DNA-binding MarR family transcriptional regulator
MQRPYRRTASELPGLDIAQQKSWQNYLHAALRFHTAVDRRLSDAHQLSVIDVRVLDILDKSPDGAVRMGDLADALGANPHHMTKRIHRLEERDLVRRESNSEDRRCVVARITDDGRRVARHATLDYAEGVRTHLVGALSRRQLATLGEGCRRINSGLKSSDATACNTQIAPNGLPGKPV